MRITIKLKFLKVTDANDFVRGKIKEVSQIKTIRAWKGKII